MENGPAQRPAVRRPMPPRAGFHLQDLAVEGRRFFGRREGRQEPRGRSALQMFAEWSRHAVRYAMPWPQRQVAAAITSRPGTPAMATPDTIGAGGRR